MKHKKNQKQKGQTMCSDFINIHPHEIKDNPFKLIGNDWMLITAGTLDSYNTMTASWGGMGFLWERNVCFCFIRPHRYTFRFVERAPFFTLSFFEETYAPALDYCGTHSGRTVDKAAATGLHPVENPPGVVFFVEARLVIICKKIYFQDLDPRHFLDSAIHQHYAKKDYHRMFIGEVWNCLKRDKTRK